ncbi:uncharacterized protein [Dermacentor albipictus]|uniref:uncharacterized protein isoform X4 n=1 Tax=Dermacentor albipictus TaxID=60249 RepID=UPI0031FD3063
MEDTFSEGTSEYTYSTEGQVSSIDGPLYSETLLEETKTPTIEASTEEDAQDSSKGAVLACILCLVLSLALLYFLLYVINNDTRYERNTLEDDVATHYVLKVIKEIPRAATSDVAYKDIPTASSEHPDRPMDPTYVRRDLRGLLCHTYAEAFLGAAIPGSCDFVMVDVPVSSPERHPVYSYMATIKINPAGLEERILKHMRSVQDTQLLLVVKRSTLRGSHFEPQAVVRGLVQKVVDMKAHGIALSDHQITDANTAVVLQDAKILSDEVQSYHGMIRYDVFTGNRSAFRAMMLDVASKPSITFVYRVSGISRTFTHLYFDNFYSKKMSEENLSAVIDRDLIQPMSTQVGNKSVALSMTLMAKECPKNTVITFQTRASCVDIPLNLTHLCTIPAGYIQCHHYSAMTRRYAGGNALTEDIFFEVEQTFAAKVYLILRQLKHARASPVAFIMERYDMELQRQISFFHFKKKKNVLCAVSPFGFTKETKDELLKFS